jgi:hypothetical protein
MQGPRINPVLDNLPLSTLKRKGVLSKTVARKTRKTIDTADVDLPGLAGKLASAFEVMISSLRFSFSLFAFLIKTIFYQSSGLTGQQLTGVTNSDRGLVLEPIQDLSTDDTLVEPSKQAEPDKAIEDVVDAILIEQYDPQRVTILDTFAGQTQQSLEQANLQSAEVQSIRCSLTTLIFKFLVFCS